MCIFAKPVVSVAQTNIFARLSDDQWQYLVYQMKYETAKKNAIILPLPTVVPGTEEDESLEFIALDKYPKFFKDLRRGFPVPVARFKNADAKTDAIIPESLVVHRVGDFVASFVPSMKDFDRLDEQFRVPQESWDEIPKYADYGFAVFQLENLEGEPHPMAFKFRSRLNTNDDDAKIFFPTVHIHDGEVHEQEGFDHALFLQAKQFDAACGAFEPGLLVDDATKYVRSNSKASDFCDIKAAKGIVDPKGLVHRLMMQGELKNDDVVADLVFESKTEKSSLKPTAGSMAIAACAAGMNWLFRRRDTLKIERESE